MRTEGNAGHAGGGYQVHSGERVVDNSLSAVLGIKPEPWTADAVCASIGGDLHFPEKGVPAGEAKRVCMGCPVREQCLQHALDNDERYGVWGGFSERERRRLNRGETIPITVRARPKSAGHDHVCPVCGTQFNGQFNAKYCGKRCGNHALYERQQAKRAAAAAKSRMRHDA